MKPNKFGTLVEAEENLRKRGYDLNLEVDDDGLLHATDTDEHFKPDEVVIKEHHRFEGISNPDDMAVIYAIAIEPDRNKKGVLIDAYGTYSSRNVSDFIRKVEKIKQQGDKQ